MKASVEEFLKTDWFAPAVVEKGSVGQCLDAVAASLNVRLDLIRQIKSRLVGKTPSSLDRLTSFGKKLDFLETTVSSRCELLRTENPAAWFRSPAAATVGPFQKDHLKHPVFGKYQISDTDLVRHSVERAWYERSLERLKFDHRNTLWGALIHTKCVFYEMITLEGPYEGRTLANVSEVIEASVASASFLAFLAKVTEEVKRVLTRLDKIYEVLWNKCEKFWLSQRSDHEKQQRESYGEHAKRIRDEFRSRRNSASEQRVLGKDNFRSEKDALKMFGFSELPDEAVLKRKYRELARKLHPDAGGDSEKFLSLNEAYTTLVTLSEKIGKGTHRFSL